MAFFGFKFKEGMILTSDESVLISYLETEKRMQLILPENITTIRDFAFCNISDASLGLK